MLKHQLTKLGASYNIFDGEELLEGSIKQIRNSINYISVVYQKVSNFGNQCGNNLIPLLNRLVSENLIDEIYEFKVSEHGVNNEILKRNIGLELSRKRCCTHHLSIDADEYYIPAEFEFLKKTVMNNNYDSSYCKMKTYFKTWEYVLDPPEEYYVSLIFDVRNKKIYGNYPSPVMVDPTRRMSEMFRPLILNRHQIQMHHGSYIRDNIGSKINNSSAVVNFRKHEIDEIVKNYENFDPKKLVTMDYRFKDRFELGNVKRKIIKVNGLFEYKKKCSVAIMAATDKKWLHKELIGGEKLIQRTLRQLYSRNCDVFITTNSIGTFPFAKEIVNNMNGHDLGCMYGVKHINPDIFIFGDVFYTDEAINAILNGDTNFYGRSGKGIVKKYGEMFAVKTDRKLWDDLDFLWGEYKKSNIKRLWSWDLYGYMQGKSDYKNGSSIIKTKSWGNWTEINDFTDDFDNMSQLNEWMGVVDFNNTQNKIGVKNVAKGCKDFIGITTYCVNKHRFEKIKTFFDSLLDVNVNLMEKYDVYISDDNSSFPPFIEFLRHLESKNFKVIRSKLNLGISKNSNKLFKAFKESDCHFMFKVEEDNEFVKDGIFDIYKTLMIESSQKHFSYRSKLYFKDKKEENFNERYYLDKNPDVKAAIPKIFKNGYQHYIKHGKNEGRDIMMEGNVVDTINGFKIRSHARTNGVFLSLTREVINIVGGFRVAPEKWGGEHGDFSKRCHLAKLCELFCDFDESNEYFIMKDLNEDYSNFSLKDRIQGNVINMPYYEKELKKEGLFANYEE